MADEELLDRIVVNPRVMVGKPVIRGTRLTVECILKALACKMSIDDILQEYRGLTQADIRACVLYSQTKLKERALEC
jgi:uncharacterized protein (DUF433 family)